MHTCCSVDAVPFWQKPGRPAPAQAPVSPARRAGIKLSRRGEWSCRVVGVATSLMPAYMFGMAAWVLKRGDPLFFPMAVLAAMGCLFWVMMAIWSWDV